jgi:hypothetical protein
VASEYAQAIAQPKNTTGGSRVAQGGFRFQAVQHSNRSVARPPCRRCIICRATTMTTCLPPNIMEATTAITVSPASAPRKELSPLASLAGACALTPTDMTMTIRLERPSPAARKGALSAATKQVLAMPCELLLLALAAHQQVTVLSSLELRRPNQAPNSQRHRSCGLNLWQSP